MIQPQVASADVRDAAARLDVHRTPVLTSRVLDERAAGSVALKCENFQRAGAFKIRGAYNAISRLSPEQLRRGVCAYSSGNHAQAVALAAGMLGSTATILMPTDAPESKKAAVVDYGGEIQTFDRYRDDRAALGEALAGEHGLALIPPYDHPDIIAGQGTVAQELLEEVPAPDALVVPMGGGGLMAGSAVATAELSPATALVGVEPEAADDQRRSLAAGERVTIPVPNTIADGLAVATPGALTFAINRRLVSEIVTVSEVEMVAAMRFLFERMKLVVEPSAAVGVAAVLSGRVQTAGRRTGVIVSGGNVSARRFAELLG